MKIHRIIIKKFRSIEKADIWIDSINAIVGQNNVGKSSLLRALNAFFNFDEEKKYFESDSHSFGPRSITKIEIHFENIDSDLIDNKYIYNNKIIIEVSISKKASGISRTVKYKNSGWNTDIEAINEIKKQLDFILIPPNRDATSFDLVEHSILKLLVEEKMKAATNSRDNYTAKFNTAIKYLENHALKHIAAEAKKQFPVDNAFNLTIKYNKEISYKNFLNDISIMISENGLTHSLVECGSGIQSLSIIALYNLLAKEKDKYIIIGLEEPETNLHPQAQKELIDYFKKLVLNDNISQFIFTTHSSAIIDKVDHTDIILFRKIYNKARGFISSVKRLPKNFYDKYGLDEFKYYQFHRYNNSDFFFSSYIIVTESKNEIEVIKKIGEKASVETDNNGLTYLNLDGVDKAKYTIHLLKELEIPYLLIVDKDFFVDYKNGEYMSSLNTRGFPEYKNSFKNQDLLNSLIPKAQTQTKLLREINSSYRRTLDILKENGVLSMNYSLDLDLVNVRKAQEEYYRLLKIPLPDRTIRTLTTKRNAIKKIKRILEVFDSLNSSNWPYSYIRIKKEIVEINKKLSFQARMNSNV